MESIWTSLREAILTLLAIIATLLCVLAIDAETGPAVLAVVLALSLSRSQLDRDQKGRVEAAIVLPLIGLVALGVGALLKQVPVVGALVFVAGMALSIWLRRFGSAARRAGSLIALPFVVLLVTPHIPSQRLGTVMALLMPILVALVALVWVSAFHWLGRRIPWLPPFPSHAETAGVPAAVPERTSALRPDATTRMALQMAAALSAAFIVGFMVFPERWSWVVLTAFIVNSGNRGRGDVAYKSVLRVLGAGAGTLAALVLSDPFSSSDSATVGFILVAVFFGIWLRPLGYAWWALFVTLALALLQHFTGMQTRLVLWPRLEEILIGAVIGVAAAWFVLPVRSLDVMKRRIADALAALSTALDPASTPGLPDDFEAAVARVEQLAPAFRAWRRVSRRFDSIQPADWVDSLAGCVDPASAVIRGERAATGLRTEVGKARRAMREPAGILPALQALRQRLEQASQVVEGVPPVGAPRGRSGHAAS